MPKLNSITNFIRSLFDRCRTLTFGAFVAICGTILAAALSILQIISYFDKGVNSDPLILLLTTKQTHPLSGGASIPLNEGMSAYLKGVRTQLHLLLSEGVDSIVVTSLVLEKSSNVPNEILDVIRSRSNDEEMRPRSYAGSRLVNNVYIVVKKQGSAVGFQTEDEMILCSASDLLMCGPPKVVELNRHGDKSIDYQLNIAYMEKEVIEVKFRAEYLYNGQSHEKVSSSLYLFN